MDSYTSTVSKADALSAITALIIVSVGRNEIVLKQLLAAHIGIKAHSAIHFEITSAHHSFTWKPVETIPPQTQAFSA